MASGDEILAVGMVDDDSALIRMAIAPSVAARADSPGKRGPALLGGIPLWDSLRYPWHMSTQIAVRLPDEMVAFLDHAVATGKATSRAAVVASALEREMRRLLGEQDAQILRDHGTADDLDALVEWTSTHVQVED